MHVAAQRRRYVGFPTPKQCQKLSDGWTNLVNTPNRVKQLVATRLQKLTGGRRLHNATTTEEADEDGFDHAEGAYRLAAAGMAAKAASDIASNVASAIQGVEEEDPQLGTW